MIVQMIIRNLNNMWLSNLVYKDREKNE